MTGVLNFHSVPEDVRVHDNVAKDKRFPTLARIFTEIITDYLKDSGLKNVSILDVGTYGGTILRTIESHVVRSMALSTIKFKFIGVDPMIEAKNGLAKHQLANRDKSENLYFSAKGEKLPFPDKSMQIVMAMDSIHHSDDPEKVIGEMWRVVSENGMMVIKDHDPDNIVRLIQCAFSDVLGNTYGKKDRIRQIREIIYGVLKKRHAYFRQTQRLRGGNSKDVSLSFKYLTEGKWEQILTGLGGIGNREKIRLIYDYIPKNLRILANFDQKNCIFILRKKVI